MLFPIDAILKLAWDSDMAKAQTSELFNCTTQQFYSIITDYSKYPEFLKEVKSCKVTKTEGKKKYVEYHINLIKEFKYTITMVETDEGNGNYKLEWDFVSGDIFKKMKGYWKLEDEKGKCRATYFVEADFGLFVPGPIANGVISVNLPNMISSYHKRISQLFGKT